MEEGQHLLTVKNLIENLLFLSNEPLSVKRLAEGLGHSKEEIIAAIDTLQEEYKNRGIKLRFVEGGWQFTTDPAFAEQIEAFFNFQRRKRLTRPALETLAIIAYQQPITRAEIEAIRGVQTAGTLQTLLEAGLIRVVGQRNTIGNPFLYGTTDEFLRHFGLGDPSELPPLEFDRELSEETPVSSLDTSTAPLSQGETDIKHVEFEPSTEETKQREYVQESA